MKLFAFSPSFSGSVDEARIQRLSEDAPRFLFVLRDDPYHAQLPCSNSWIIEVDNVEEAEAIISRYGEQ